MRSSSGRPPTNAAGKWDSSLGAGYSSSEDDEMTRLKPNSAGTSTSGGSSSGQLKNHRAGHAGGHRRQHHSNSEGATSPNESDNTYAEASLLQQRPIRYGQSNINHSQGHNLCINTLSNDASFSAVFSSKHASFLVALS